jgi:protein-arginine kinase activator protein McsA
MGTEPTAKKDNRDASESLKCISCERTLKEPSEGVRSGKSVMCVSCYESLLNPFPKCCAGGAAL